MTAGAARPDPRRARIGIIGTGWWATYAHLPALTSYPRADVVAIADPSPERLASAAEHFGIGARFADYHTLLDHADLDGVVVATPHTTHAAIATDVLRRGIALLLEKPMVLHAREARDLVKLAERQRVPLVIGYPYHFVEQHARLRARIAEGALGHIQLTHTLFASMVLEYYRANPQAYADVFKWQVTGPQPSTYSEPAVAGGGQGHLQVTHAAALLLWLTNLEPREVAAFVERFDLKVDLCDAISVRFASGALGTLASTGGIPAAQSSHQQLELRVYGSGGYALLDAMAGTCRIYYNDGSVEQLDDVAADGRYPQEAPARHLVDLILDESRTMTNMSTGEIGARTVELLEATYRSAAERRAVRIDELSGHHSEMEESNGA
ncbi:MAG: Gfo/Idh/MocA family oxidoreductase [Chloroflexi bacterium]|nr:Gfo/Idh/MocA family oxidoreductase [Chloroflexota bacterium]